MAKLFSNGKMNETHPAEQLKQMAADWKMDILGLEFAQKMDEVDPLRKFRDMFYYPKNGTLEETDMNLIDPEKECVYFSGNSLGLLPRNTERFVKKELTKWAELGSQGYLRGVEPWAFCDEFCEEEIAKIIGAKREEVALMNGLSINIHLLLISFYNPTPKRHKILTESHVFPSDLFIVESQIRLHGYDPEKSLICIAPREGEDLLRQEDILATIEEEGDSIAVIMFGGVQYYTGQVFDMEAITKAGHAKGCFVGFDLAHAVGNVELQLHDWEVDFACWCTYKYLNGGPGCIAGAFLHEKHKNNNFPKLHGWWSHEFEPRVKLTKEFELSPGIAGYRITNPPPLLCASLQGSLEVFKQTSIHELRTKSKLLTGYLEFLLTQHYPRNKEGKPWVEIITPLDPEKRGCQLSARFSVPAGKLLIELKKRGVVLDKREPDVLRLAPTPLYNSFQDIHTFIAFLGTALKASKSDSS